MCVGSVSGSDASLDVYSEAKVCCINIVQSDERVRNDSEKNKIKKIK